MSSLNIYVSPEQMKELIGTVNESKIENEIVEDEEHIGGIIFSILFFGVILLIMALV